MKKPHWGAWSASGAVDLSAVLGGAGRDGIVVRAAAARPLADRDRAGPVRRLGLSRGELLEVVLQQLSRRTAVDLAVRDDRGLRAAAAGDVAARDTRRSR